MTHRNHVSSILVLAAALGVLAACGAKEERGAEERETREAPPAAEGTVPGEVSERAGSGEGAEGEAMSLVLTSAAFEHNAVIPERYTCDGEDISPAMAWTGMPEGTKSLALIVDDPDAPDPAAPRMIWVHWVLYNIPPSAGGLPEAVGREDLPPGTLEGTNDWKRTGWGGPCPPIGRHRYFHKLYALDVVLPDLKNPPKKKLEEAMKGHILAETELIGTYQH